jgi:phosphonate transport system substrate-binding protein
MTRTALLLCAIICTAILLNTGCKPKSNPALRLSMIPSTDPGKIVRESQPFVDYLEKAAGAKVELTVPTNYAAVVEAIANDQVDIAYLGGFTYVQASQRSGVLPLVQRDRDREFHSLFISQPGSGIASIADLKGHTFAFGDVNSTSGHLMPEYFMREAKVPPDALSKVIYTGGHDATALAVANKKVDAGAMDEAVYERMVKENKLDTNQAKVFYKTPPFFDYIWVARKGLDPQTAEAFSSAMLKLNAGDVDQKKVLDILSAAKYVKANDADYDKLRQAARDAGLVK